MTDKDRIANAVAQLAVTCRYLPGRRGLERFIGQICVDLHEYPDVVICETLLGFRGAEQFPTLDQIESRCEETLQTKRTKHGHD